MELIPWVWVMWLRWRSELIWGEWILKFATSFWKKVLKWQISRFLSYAKLSVSSRHIRVLGQFQINKKNNLNQRIKIQQTFPSFPHNLHFFPTAKPNTTYIFVLILANDELFEFCVSCGEFGGNMKVFVEFVLRLIFCWFEIVPEPLYAYYYQRLTQLPRVQAHSTLSWQACNTVKPVSSGPHIKRTPAWVPKFSSHLPIFFPIKSNLFSADPSIKRAQRPK